MGDDDAPYIGADPTFWLAKSPYLFERWSVPNYDSSYSDQFVGDPLPPTAIGSGTAPISMTSLTQDPVGYPAEISYSVTGTATFTHTRPPVSFPAALSYRADLHLGVAQGFSADVANVTWQPFTLPAAYYVASATRVFWKEHNASTWSHTDMLDPDDTSYQLSNLKLGTVYDFAVARVMPGGLLALYTATTYSTPPLPSQPTNILGWLTTTTKGAVGMTVTSDIQVTNGFSARNVVLQSKKAGTTTWVPVATVLTTKTGDATLTLKVASVNTQWRVHVPATASFDAATSAARLLVPKTKISGVNLTDAKVATGTKINDTIVVTPGANRSVSLQYRLAGSTAWTVQQEMSTDSAGMVVLPELARKGSYEWQAVVSADAGHAGSRASTGIRTITGI